MAARGKAVSSAVSSGRHEMTKGRRKTRSIGQNIERWWKVNEVQIPGTKNALYRAFLDSLKSQTIYNWISAGVWQSGVHYFKPTPRKLIFHYPTIKRWVEGQNIGKGHTGPRQGTARDATV
jgi:hypothetical protein